MRKGRRIWVLVILVLMVLILSVVLIITSLNKNEDNEGNNNTGMPNPASTYCTEKGYNLDIRADEQGNQYGVCIFPDGSECEEWAYYRGECEIGDSLK